MTTAELRLTELSSCAGCAAKLGQEALAELLTGLHQNMGYDPNLLIGAGTGDDAGVYRIDPDRALVQTLDFFTPIVDDPYDYGRIAATNALSDVYAMGGRPLTAMNIVGVPVDKVSPDAVRRILRGGADVVRAAQCCLVGGHTIRSQEPIYGLSVTGLVHPDHLISNAHARPGDLLVLTKPLGTGIVTTSIKRRLAADGLADAAVRSMCTLNLPGHELALAGLVCAGTDVTGFGLLGHLANICRGSDVSATIDAAAVPILGDQVLALVDLGCVPGGTRNNLRVADDGTNWGDTPDRLRLVLTDAQTSGPLLLCVRPDRLEAVIEVLARHRTLARAVIGRIHQRGGSLLYVR